MIYLIFSTCQYPLGIYFETKEKYFQLFLLGVLTRLLLRCIVASMAKYDSLRKIARNQAIIEYHLAHLKFSYKELGEIYHIDASRAWRICNNGKKDKEKSNA